MFIVMKGCQFVTQGNGGVLLATIKCITLEESLTILGTIQYDLTKAFQLIEE